MATLLQRIQLNKSLLEQANDGVKTFNSFVKKKIEDNKDKEISSSVLEENYPPIGKTNLKIFLYSINSCYLSVKLPIIIHNFQMKCNEYVNLLLKI